MTIRSPRLLGVALCVFGCAINPQTGQQEVAAPVETQFNSLLQLCLSRRRRWRIVTDRPISRPAAQLQWSADTSMETTAPLGPDGIEMLFWQHIFHPIPAQLLRPVQRPVSLSEHGRCIETPATAA